MQVCPVFTRDFLFQMAGYDFGFYFHSSEYSLVMTRTGNLDLEWL